MMTSTATRTTNGSMFHPEQQPQAELAEAQVLNNSACDLIANHEFELAAPVLMNALMSAKKLAVATFDEEDEDGQSKSTPCSSSQPLQFSSVSCPGTRTRKMKEVHFSTGSEDRKFFLFCKPVKSLTVHENYDNDFIANLSFVIMFNLGLCHHVGALEQTEDRSALRRKLEVAQHLYELTFQMQSQLDQTNYLLAAALINNLSLLHKSLENEYEAGQCDELLLSTLLLVVDIGEYSQYNEYLDGFMSNVIHLMVRNPQTASAA